MTEKIDPTACPFCLQANRCNVAAKHACWCNELSVPKQLIDLLPDTAKNKSCICRACIIRFNANPALFLTK